MNYFKKLLKITRHIIFVISFIFFSTLEAKNYDKFSKADNISDYFSGILLLNENQYGESSKFLKKLDGLEDSHTNYSKKYLYTLINSGNFNQAFSYAKKLEKNRLANFESDIIIGIYYLKSSKFKLANSYFLKAKNRNKRSILNNYIANSLYLWTKLNDYELDNAILKLNKLDGRLENLKKIQRVFLYCFYSRNETDKLFEKLISNKKTDFSRYNFFYAKYLISQGKNEKASNVIKNALKLNPRNLLLSQYKIDLEKPKNRLNFDCKKEENVAAEIIYITSNFLSSQSIFNLSNFYLNLAKYLNRDFKAFDTLLAENFYKIDNLNKAKTIYRKLSSYGSAFDWHAKKQISRILIKEESKKESLNLLKTAFKKLPIKGIYETFDYAEFLKNNEKFESSISLYTEILNLIDKDHVLYPKVRDGRGVAYEKIGQWNKAEKDLLASLEASPDQAYVINYLAYSWIEQGVKIEKSLRMLEKANKLKSDDPFIIDSLGWALFKLKKYKESKKYLQQAVKLMPADPIVNDHYGDVLWKNGKQIQARYYWNYVLRLEKAEKDLKEKIEKKLIIGL